MKVEKSIEILKKYGISYFVNEKSVPLKINLLKLKISQRAGNAQNQVCSIPRHFLRFGKH